MAWTEGDIEDVVIRDLDRYTDDRGWLMELYRTDEMDAENLPAMAYVSLTHPGVSRGPHEHKDQTDNFGFVGPGDFRLRMFGCECAVWIRSRPRRRHPPDRIRECVAAAILQPSRAVHECQSAGGGD